MTVRGSRSAAAAAAGAGVLIVAALGAAVFLLGFTSALPIGAFVLTADVFTVAWFLRPMSLSVEGADLVYRATGTEKRIALAQIAVCHLESQVWAFSDSAGARLLGVEAQRFSDATISALCAEARIPYKGPSQAPLDKARRDLSSGKGVRAGGVILGILFLVATLVTTYVHPQTGSNANLADLIALLAVFGVGCAVMAGTGQYMVIKAREAVRVATGAVQGVAQLHPDVIAHGLDLPPCGVLHRPKVELYLHEDPKTVRSGVAIVSVVFVVLLAGLVALAIYVSLPVFAGLAVLLTAFYSIQLMGQLRELRFGGLYADDLHVAKITTDLLGRLERQVYERAAVLQVKIERGRIDVVGVDGSTLFWAVLITAPDMERYAEFLGVRVERGDQSTTNDSIAVPPTRTPAGVLSLNVRKAAGVMQAIGGLCVFLGVINLAKLPGTPPDRRATVLILLAALAAYGLVMWGLGYVLAQGRPHSREIAMVGGGAATGLFSGAWFVAAGNETVFGLIGLLMLPFYLTAVYLLRKPTESRP